MNKLVIAAIAAATILPSAAMAQGSSQSFGRHDTKVVVVDRGHHRGPGWHRPAAQHLTIGSRLEPGFIARQDVIKHPKQYRLAKAGSGNRWLKVRNNAVLVNLHTGRVLDVVHRAF
ncbi:MAG: RcnB family protein [Sphingobium sp.]|nr:RcnB family protein [Sphingobium sp.]